MAKRFWMKWETKLWLSDPALSRCPPGVRGIWMDLLCAMMESGATGEITGTVEELARIARCTPEEMREACARLASSLTAIVRENDGVLTLINRKMQRESKERQTHNKRQLKYDRKKRDGKMTSDLTPDSQGNDAVESKSKSESSISPSRKNGEITPSKEPPESAEEEERAEVEESAVGGGYGSMSADLLHIARDAGAEFNISPAKIPELNQWIKLVGYPLARDCLDEARARKGISGYRALQYIQPMSISRKAENDLKNKRPSHHLGGVALRQDR